MKKTVTILLSTYNGEKYLEEQLQSLFNQTYWENCTLFVRDDGSKDGTIDILKKYEKENKLILNCGENIGFAKSFFWLLNNAPNADFYSFCDQDDVWFEDKIERAVSMLSEYEITTPLFYFSNCNYCDSELKFIKKRNFNNYNFSFEKSLFDCWSLGFTILINRSFFDIIVKTNFEGVISHDHYIQILAMLFAKQVYDTESTALYRRHINNTSISENNKVALNFDRIKRLFSKKGFKINNESYCTLYNTYYENLTEYQRELLRNLSNEKRKLKESFFLIFNKKKYRNTIFEDLLIRILFILGRL